MPKPDFATLGSAPITPDSPTGASVRNDPDFDQLKAEIAKLELDPTGVKWGEIVTISSNILAAKSKDILVAVYLAAALIQTQGMRGLAAGMRVCKDMISSYWQSMFPEASRLKGRAAALTWLGERLEKILPGLSQPTEDDRTPLEEALTLTQEIGQLTSDKFGEEGPNVPLMERLIRERLSLVPAPAAPAAESAAPQQQETQAVSTTPSAPARREIDSAGAARSALPDLAADLVKAAQFLQKENPADALSYRLLRTALWNQTIETPPSPAGGDSSLPAQWDQRLKSRDYPALLADAEVRLATEPFWLDLNYYSCRAMEGMGYAYDLARKVIAEETAALVRRMPDLLSVNLAGGVPAAGPTVRVWITNEVLLGGGPSASKGESKAEEKVRQARMLVARKQLAEAVSLMGQEAQSAAGRRDRFLARLTTARLCIEGGKPALALPLLESLDAESEKYILADWEPTLCAEVIKSLLDCHRALGTGEDERTKKLYARLSNLDVLAALTLDGK